MKPLDKIALIITVTTAAILLLTVVSPLLTGRAITDTKARMIAGLISSFVAILSMYVGAQLKARSEDARSDDTQDEDPKP